MVLLSMSFADGTDDQSPDSRCLKLLTEAANLGLM